jgi:hypothetical protein
LKQVQIFLTQNKEEARDGKADVVHGAQLQSINANGGAAVNAADRVRFPASTYIREFSQNFLK